MFVALDATYVVDPHPSGIAIYSREILDGLARTHPSDRFLHLYRWKQYRHSSPPAFPNVRNRLMLPASPIGQPDLFHALNQRVDWRPAQRVISTFHDLFVMAGEYSSADFRARFTLQARRAADRSDLLIAVSQFTKDQIVAYLNVDPARVCVIPHGVHLPPDVSPPESREKMILCVGALQIRKNIVRLVEALEQIPPAVLHGWTLVLAGSSAGYGAAQILEHIRVSKVAPQIELRGYVTAADLLALYQRASIFAFPSLDEGFGIPVLEAMAHGIPVLTSNRSSLPEVAGDAAVLVDPQSADAISSELQRLMQDSILRQRLSHLGMIRAKLFPWGRAVKETHAAYNKLLR